MYLRNLVGRQLQVVDIVRAQILARMGGDRNDQVAKRYLLDILPVSVADIL